MSLQKFALTVALAVLPLLPTAAHASDPRDLRGSLASMRRQHRVAERNNFAFLRTVADVLAFIRADRLERLSSSSTLAVHDAMFPYARPQVVLFIQRLAEQYHDATGFRLVVTSLTRPISRQPRNAHRLSVHPAGMAVDLHVPATPSARLWLEYTLLSLESKGLIDATREHYPSHYHVAVFPQNYPAYVGRVDGTSGPAADSVPADTTADVDEPSAQVVASLEPESDVRAIDVSRPSRNYKSVLVEKLQETAGVLLSAIAAFSCPFLPFLYATAANG